MKASGGSASGQRWRRFSSALPSLCSHFISRAFSPVALHRPTRRWRHVHLSPALPHPALRLSHLLSSAPVYLSPLHSPLPIQSLLFFSFFFCSYPRRCRAGDAPFKESQRMQTKLDALTREVFDLQETINWKDKKIGVGSPGVDAVRSGGRRPRAPSRCHCMTQSWPEAVMCNPYSHFGLVHVDNLARPLR